MPFDLGEGSDCARCGGGGYIRTDVPILCGSGLFDLRLIVVSSCGTCNAPAMELEWYLVDSDILCRSRFIACYRLPNGDPEQWKGFRI